jgi:anti-anti-sigma regulatory factor
VCCPHDHDGLYRRRVAEFFTDGLRAGRRVAYAGADGPEAARADLAGVDDLDRLVAGGAVQLLSVREVYGSDGPVAAEAVVSTLAAATEAALADGFRGLRVSADVTELVRTPAQQDAFTRCEFLLDRYMARHPLSALCGYGLDLGSETVTDFASLHDAAPSDDAVFRVFGCADGAIGLAGQFDLFGVAALERVLSRLRASGGAGALVVDLAGVEYVDHRLLLTLNNHARRSGAALRLRSVPPFTGRLMELLPVSVLRHVEAVRT